MYIKNLILKGNFSISTEYYGRDSSNSQVYRFLMVNMVNPEKKNTYARKKPGIRNSYPIIPHRGI